VVHKSYEVEGMLFGVRTNSDEVADWLSETFGEYELVDEDADPYFSVVIAEEGVGKRYHILYKESRAMVKTLDLRELGQALLYEVEAIGVRNRKDTLFVEMAVVERDGVTALVPPLYPAFLRTLGRRAEKALTLPLSPVVAVDLETGGLLPFRPNLHLPKDALDRFAELGPSSDGSDLWEPPDHVDQILFFQWTEEGAPALPLSRAVTLYNLARQVPNLHLHGARGMHGLARLVEGARGYHLQEAPPKALLESISGVLAERELVPA
jgi:hypothetical protein